MEGKGRELMRRKRQTNNKGMERLRKLRKGQKMKEGDNKMEGKVVDEINK